MMSEELRLKKLENAKKWQKEHKEEFGEILKRYRIKKGLYKNRQCTICGGRLVSFTKTEDNPDRDYHKKCFLAKTFKTVE